MSKLFYILTLFLCVQSLFAQDAFDRGNELYRKGDYAGAAKSYESILKDGKESAEVYFNLGNAYYKMDSVAPAIYYYEKALLLKPNNKDIKVNLSFAQKMAIDDIKAVPKAGFSKILYGFAGSWHYDTWAWIAVGAAVLFLLLFIGYYLAGTTRLKRGFFVGMFVTLPVLLLTVATAFFVRSETAAERPAIVFAEVVSVKSEPLENADDAFILHAGTKVFITETLDNWKKIQLADDTVGWIEESAVKELK